MSVDLPTKPSSARRVEPPAQRAARAMTARGALALAGFVLVAAGVGLHNPVLVLCGLVMATAGLLMRWLQWDLAIPAAVVALITASTLLGVTAGLLGVDLLAMPWTVATVHVFSVGLAVFVARGPSRLVTRSVPTGKLVWAAYASVAMAAGIGLAQGFVEQMWASWAFQFTDLTQHMIILQDVQRAGGLDYSANSYPRAFHMLAALVSVPGAPVERPSEMLAYNARLVAAASWLSLALLLWTGTTLLLRLGAALALPRFVATGAAVLFGAGVLLTNSFIAAFVYMGAVPSILAVSIMWALPVAALALPSRTSRMTVLPVLAATSVMLLAHLWQTLIVVPPLALAIYAAPRLRSALSRLARTRLGRPGKTAVLVTATSLTLLAVASIPVISVQQAGGVALASSAGAMRPPPWLVLTLAPVVVGWMLWRCRHGWSRLFAGSLLGLLVATGLMLRGAGHGFDVTQYYPLKVLWFFAIVLSPVLILCAVDLGWRVLGPIWRVLARLGKYARVSRFALTACMSAIAIAFGLPLMLGSSSATLGSLERSHSHRSQRIEQSSGQSSTERLDIAQVYGTRYRPAVTVPVAVGLSEPLGKFGSYIVSKLISFQTGQPQNHGAPSSVCREVAQVAGSANAVVVTQMDVRVLRETMRKQGCGDVRAVQIPGGLKAAANGR